VKDIFKLNVYYKAVEIAFNASAVMRIQMSEWVLKANKDIAFYFQND